MPKVDLEAIPQTNTTGYPAEYARVVGGRWYRKLQHHTGLTDFGVSHVVLQPGFWSAHRHWHEGEDELVVMIAGEATLLDDSGETRLRAGDVAVFRKGDGNGHCLINETDKDCVYVAVGKPGNTDCHYPDIDMHLFAGKGFKHKDGSDF